jgi:hypothetical protein
MSELAAMPEERAKHTIILVSAWANLENNADLAADGNLPKPFTVPQLLNVVGTVGVKR